MFIFGLPFLILLIVIPLWVFNRYKETGSTDSAIEILKKRYIRGEIDKREFVEKKKTIVSE